MKKPPFYKTFLYAINGLLHVIKSERNVQIEVAMLFINLFSIYFLKVSTIESIVLILLCFMVITTEILNTAIEKICDFIHPEFYPKIGIIKDIAAAAVLVMCIGAIIIGAIIYFPYLF